MPRDADAGELRWSCMVCGEVRPDALIDVYSETRELTGGVPMKVNVRYCKDRPECVEGAQRHQLLMAGTRTPPP